MGKSRIGNNFTIIFHSNINKGQMYGSKNAFYQSIFDKTDYKSIVACTYNGCLYLYTFNDSKESWDS